MSSRNFEELASQFDGVIHSHSSVRECFEDLHGDFTVLRPHNEDAIAIALNFAAQNNRGIFIRSGHHCSKPAQIEASHSIVLSMQDFNHIEEVEGHQDLIKVGCAVTIEQLLAYLQEHQRFLPLPDIAHQSVIAAVRGNSSGSFPLTIGPLKSFVVAYDGLDFSGTRFSANLFQTGVVTSVTFKTKSFGQLRSFDFTIGILLYHEENLQPILQTLGSQNEELRDLDVSLRVCHERHNLPTIQIALAGTDKTDLIDKLMKEMLGEKKQNHSFGFRDPHGVLSALNQWSHNGANEFFLDAHRITGHVRREGLPNLKEPINQAMVKLNCRLSVTFQLQPDLNYSIHAFVFNDPNTDNDEKAFEMLQKSFDAKLSTTESPIVLSSGFTLLPRPQTSLKTFEREKPIPRFKGEIFTQEDPDYKKKIQQYATSSYPEESQRMSPLFVAYPLDEDDVKVAVQYAGENEKKVVARSGGHQYCGLSSGGIDTIVLSLDHFNKIKVEKPLAIIGPGAHLKDVAATFKKAGVTIPHGECPLVCIGGHAQTGGYGHLLRSFGLSHDRVQSFKLVTAKGELIHVTRENHEDLFKAVLGGSPGCFGIITEITFEAVLDTSYPQSAGYNRIFTYQSSFFRSALTEAKHWTEQIAKHKWSQGLDMMMTVYSNPRDIRVLPMKVLPDVFFLELVSLDKTTTKEMDDAIKRAKKGRRLPNVRIPFGFHGEKPLSYMSDSFVRKTLSDGREFPFPYEKRFNATKQPLTDTFVDELVRLIDDVLKTRGQYLVFQMLLGGGKYAENKNHTSIAHRDVLYGLVFDCFYDPKVKGSREVAKNFQQRFHHEILPLLNRNGEKEIRMQWASFGPEEERRMHEEKTQQYYYDDPQSQIQFLQKVKHIYDPENRFSTSFTIPLQLKGSSKM